MKSKKEIRLHFSNYSSFGISFISESSSSKPFSSNNGTSIPFNSSSNNGISNPLDLMISDQIIAQGEVVAVDNNYGLRIKNIISKYGSHINLLIIFGSP